MQILTKPQVTPLLGIKPRMAARLMRRLGAREVVGGGLVLPESALNEWLLGHIAEKIYQAPKNYDPLDARIVDTTVKVLTALEAMGLIKLNPDFIPSAIKKHGERKVKLPELAGLRAG